MQGLCVFATADAHIAGANMAAVAAEIVGGAERLRKSHGSKICFLNGRFTSSEQFGVVYCGVEHILDFMGEQNAGFAVCSVARKR